MTNDPLSLRDLGWSNYFLSQLDLDELESQTPARVSEVMRDRVTALTEAGPLSLVFPGDASAGDYAVGDWVLAEGSRVVRRLDRKTEMTRRASGPEARAQLIAANIDTLFVTTSCNDDFNLPRLERALALAYEAGVEPVILLTKADLADPDPYVEQARSAARDIEVIALNAKSDAAAAQLTHHCGPGKTVALIGMSGTGKSTLTNALCGIDTATGAIREDDARGRHTTTARALHRCLAGGWLIDTPGMREMGVFDAAMGIDAVFSEITELAETCRFRDCAHEGEPGCAVQAAIAAGDLDPARLTRWRKLKAEDRQASASVAEGRARDKRLSRHYNRTQAAGRRSKTSDDV
ncbi:ribosome small subunit-dependent GTPase A [Pseudooceanicola sp.]|uniref:ribosome small subunit-dependent GTPase A n=1 Tax=Pseudooceanicola sp. TaxID=1914328 RepID=UPI002631416F|nr:ribosome small subunit-dependent GTPase A [Pseudooceanicola sp.]MDF1855151.1 ribosome small subunit-dependent GTPase A [Pseudooceanicola sp.]